MCVREQAAPPRIGTYPPPPDLDVSIDWLYAGSMASVTRYRCEATDRAPGREQRQAAHVIGFPYQGVFALHQGRRCVTIEQGTVLFLNAGASYRTSHPCGAGDHGSAIAVRTDVLVEALSRYDPTVADRPEAPFLAASGPSSSRTYLPATPLSPGLEKTRS